MKKKELKKWKISKKIFSIIKYKSLKNLTNQK